jgi:hypothetical protein
VKTTVFRVPVTAILLLTGGGGCASRGSSTHESVRATGAPTPAATPTVAPPPRLLVTIVVDQLAAWIATQRWPVLPADGGFARLRREGLYARELRYDYAVTDTAPGHSALYTGAVPRVSGIIGNDVIRVEKGETVSILADAASRLVVTGAGAPSGKPASSLAVLAVETLADVLAAHDPQAAIFSFSLKDRGALFAAGRRPTLALWFDPAEETFVTSTAFATAIPDWVTPLAGRDAVRAARAQAWTLLDPGWVAAHALTGDSQAGECDYAGLGTTFPHPIPSAQAMRATPVGDDLLFALARAAIAHAAPAPHATLLALSLSSNDYVGHMYGPDSWEAWDELLRLDRRLAELLRSLDRAVGARGYAVLLSADHGIGALPELEGRAREAACRRALPSIPRSADTPAACAPGRRLSQPEIIAAFENAGRRELGAGPDARFVAGIADPLLFFTARARALGAADRARLVGAGGAALRERFGIAEVVDIRAATAPCAPAPDESLPALVCRSLRPDGPADLYLVVGPRSFFDARYTPEHGVNHGTPYLYDRAVPLLVRAPGRITPGTVRDAPVTFTAFTRTAASLLGLPPPGAAGAGEDLAAAPPSP